MNKRIVITVIFLLATLGYALYQSSRLDSMLSTEDETILKEAPNIAFKLADGSLLNIHSYTKENNIDVLGIHFWATWCGPCEGEFPELVKLEKELESQGKFKIIYVAVDDDVKKVEKFARRFKKFKSDIVIAFDNSSIHREVFGTVRVPETYFFNNKFQTIKKFAGAMEWSKSYFNQLIKKWLTTEN